jgi:hypothetical protein
MIMPGNMKKTHRYGARTQLAVPFPGHDLVYVTLRDVDHERGWPAQVEALAVATGRKLGEVALMLIRQEYQAVDDAGLLATAREQAESLDVGVAHVFRAALRRQVGRFLVEPWRLPFEGAPSGLEQAANELDPNETQSQ